MDWKSRMKLVEQGFTVIRRDDHPQPSIIKATEARDWVVLEWFDTKSERNEAVKNMVEDNQDVILDE